MAQRQWTDEEIHLFKSLYADTRNGKLGEMFGCGYKAVKGLAARLGLMKTRKKATETLAEREYIPAGMTVIQTLHGEKRIYHVAGATITEHRMR
jgi:hypothetical protein